MKVFKIIEIGLCTFIDVAAGVSFLLPDHYRVERSILIKAPADTIYTKIVDFRAWPQWSPWYEMDPKTQYTYTGIFREVGSTQEWVGKKTGKGHNTITTVVPNK